jgi:hypothetical protein
MKRRVFLSLFLNGSEMSPIIRLSLVLMIICCMLPAAKAGNTLIIGATIVSYLELDVRTGSVTWVLDPEASPYTQILDKNNGVMVRANKAGWALYARSEQATLTNWDGTNYNSGALQSPLTLKSYPEGNAIGHTIDVSVSNQELVTEGERGGNKKTGLGFTQPVSWDDDPLPSGHKYHTILTFTASAA